MHIRDIKGVLLKNIEKLRSPTGYLKAGYPRYSTLFGRDSLISAWQMLEVDPSIAQATLQTLAKFQGKTVILGSEEEPGKILHEFRFDVKSQNELPYWEFPYYGSVDSTPLFLFLAGEYFRQTKDNAFLLRIWDNILAAFRWIKDYGDKDEDGFVEYERKNPHGLFHQGWKDSVKDHLNIEPPVAIVEAQGYTYSAYQSLISLGKEFGKNQVSKEAVIRSEFLRKKFNKDFWMKEEAYFALALNKGKKQRTVVTSNPGHLLFTGIVAPEKLKPLVSRLFQSDLWTPYGIRTHSTEEPNFDPYSYHKGSIWPHDNWIIYKGLQRLGFDYLAARIKKALLRAFRELDGKIPELYTVTDDEIIDLSQIEEVQANPLQAWATAGLLDMILAD